MNCPICNAPARYTGRAYGAGKRYRQCDNGHRWRCTIAISHPDPYTEVRTETIDCFTSDDRESRVAQQKLIATHAVFSGNAICSC